MEPPVALDIDGTLTRAAGGLDPQIFDVLRDWNAPVVLATGRAFPYPVALCDFLGIETRVVAENGGVVATDDAVEVLGDGDAPHRVVSEYRSRGFDIGRGEADLLNRWRETEVSVATDSALEPLVELAERYGHTRIHSCPRRYWRTVTFTGSSPPGTTRAFSPASSLVHRRRS